MSRSLLVRSLALVLLCSLALAPVAGAAPPAQPSNPGATAQPAPPQPFFANPGGPNRPAAVPAARPSNCTQDNRTYTGGTYQYWICMPPGGVSWNNDLVVYAHGYVGIDQPIAVPEAQLKVNYNGNEVYLTDVLTGVYNIFGLDYHFAVAVTSYTQNGLALKPALSDLADMVDVFKSGHPTTKNVYLLGVSEGGLITALAAEQPAGHFSGGLAACGPVGDFALQINYFGDFRVLFDYFFPGLMPGTPISIPAQYVHQAAWDTYYRNTVLPVLPQSSSQVSLTQLLKVSHAPPYGFTSFDAVSTTVGTLLWYSIFATNDATVKLGGQPYDNQNRVYSGSDSQALDAAINAWVDQTGRRYAASSAALAEIAAHYQTNGLPQVPLVTVHTTLDEVVPYQHEVLYRAKVIRNDMLGRWTNTRSTPTATVRSMRSRCRRHWRRSSIVSRIRGRPSFPPTSTYRW